MNSLRTALYTSAGLQALLLPIGDKGIEPEEIIGKPNLESFRKGLNRVAASI